MVPLARQAGVYDPAAVYVHVLVLETERVPQASAAIHLPESEVTAPIARHVREVIAWPPLRVSEACETDAVSPRAEQAAEQVPGFRQKSVVAGLLSLQSVLEEQTGVHGV